MISRTSFIIDLSKDPSNDPSNDLSNSLSKHLSKDLSNDLKTPLRQFLLNRQMQFDLSNESKILF